MRSRTILKRYYIGELNKSMYRTDIEKPEHTPSYIDGIYNNLLSLVVDTMKIAQDIAVIHYDMTGVKSINPTKEHATYNPSNANDRFYKLSERLEGKEKKFKFNSRLIKFLEDTARIIPDPKVKQYVYKKYLADVMPQYRQVIREYRNL